MAECGALWSHQVKVVDHDDAGTCQALEIVDEGTDDIEGGFPFKAEQFASVLADARVVKA
jgi:hypothetical protein